MEKVIYKGEKIAIEIIDDEIIGYELTESGEPIFESVFIVEDTKNIENLLVDTEVLTAKNGCKYIKVDFNDMVIRLNGAGICDYCGNIAINDLSKTANLIPVLNSVYCDKCFTRWENTTKKYKEDTSYEEDKTKYYKDILDER